MGLLDFLIGVFTENGYLAVFTILLIVYFVLSQAVALAMRMIEARVAHWKFPNRVSPFKTLKMLVSR